MMNSFSIQLKQMITASITFRESQRWVQLISHLFSRQQRCQTLCSMLYFCLSNAFGKQTGSSQIQSTNWKQKKYSVLCRLLRLSTLWVHYGERFTEWRETNCYQASKACDYLFSYLHSVNCCKLCLNWLDHIRLVLDQLVFTYVHGERFSWLSAYMTSLALKPSFSPP